MNLRILKKLSKRAAPYLALLGENREQFKAEKGENYIGSLRGFERKHWERMRSVHNEVIGDGYKYPANNGNGYISVRPPNHPRKGTVMVGGMSGYYEPEWDETTAYEALVDVLFNIFTPWDDYDEVNDIWPSCFRNLSTPRLIFLAADELIERAQRADKEG